MTLTDVQLKLLADKRRENPPSYYSADSDSTQQISDDTESSLILLSSEVKQQAARYVSQLLDLTAPSTVHDKVVERMVAKQSANISMALTEMESVIDSFESFKDKLTGGGSTDVFYATGMSPLLKALLRGLGSVRNKVDASKFLSLLLDSAVAKHAGGLTDKQQKELRSWRRILASYP